MLREVKEAGKSEGKMLPFPLWMESKKEKVRYREIENKTGGTMNMLG